MQFRVAPFTGAWIEMALAMAIGPERGVAPFTGAWIEMALAMAIGPERGGRTLHGCVD